MIPVAKPNPWRVIAVALALAVIPVILTAWIGAPIPRSLPTIDQVETLLRGLTMTHWHALFRILLWASWLAVLIGSIWEIAAYLRSKRHNATSARRPWFLRLTGGLVLGTTATTALTAAPVVAEAADSTEADIPTGTPEAEPTGSKARSTRHGTATISSNPTEPGDEEYTVQDDDNLWDIAVDELGDGSHMTTIFEDNKNKPQPDGSRLTDPDLIQPGWKLDLSGVAESEPPPTTEPAEEERPHHGNPLPQLDDESPPENPAPAPADHDASGPGSEWMWWAGGFVSTAFAVGLAVHIRRARRRVHAFEKRTGRAGPRIRLPEPLDELEAISESVDADIDQPPAIGVTAGGTAVPILEATSEGLGLAGPGAESAARATIAAALTAGDQDPYSHGCDIFITRPALSQLLDDEPPPAEGIHRLWIYPDSDVALRKLSREILSRVRDPEAIDAPVLVVLDDDADRAVMASLMRQAEHLDIGALILGEWPDNTITINADGTSDHPELTRASTLSTEAFAATLFTLDDVREALDEPLSPPADCEDEREMEIASTGTLRPDELDIDRDPTEEDIAGGSQQQASPSTAPAPSDPPPPLPSDATGKPLRLRLLGKFALTHRGEPVNVRRAKSRELLACLAAQQHAATRDYLLEAIVSETVVPKARNHLESVVTNTRKDLREATSEPGTTKFILYADKTYRLDPDWFTTDLHEFDQHLADAAAAEDQTDALAHLAAALELYTDEVAADIDAESIWPHPIRAHYADQAHAACLTLADHAANIHDQHTAIAWLDRAISINKYNETAYVRLIRIHQEHGDPDNASSIYRQLTTALAAIGAKPNHDYRLV